MKFSYVGMYDIIAILKEEILFLERNSSLDGLILLIKAQIAAGINAANNLERNVANGVMKTVFAEKAKNIASFYSPFLPLYCKLNHSYNAYSNNKNG